MKEPKLTIVHVAAEVDPFSKSGGLADVASALPRALRQIGHRVFIIAPLHGGADDVNKFQLKLIAKDVKIELSEGVKAEADFWQGQLNPDVVIYFVDNARYFGNRKSLYGSKNENARFFFFDLAALQLLREIKLVPDIIHCHDWHSGLIPYFLKHRFKHDEQFRKTATLFTIHNLLFQFGHNWWEVPNELRDDGYSRLPVFSHGERFERINFAKRAIINADLINAVSEQYAHEILTKDFGEDLHRVLKNREARVFGIVNGIDYQDYNPKTDPGLPQTYDADSLALKAKNKTALQKYFGLPHKPDTPLLGMVTRITEQKGFDLVMAILEDLLRLDVQFVIMGTGEKQYETLFRKLHRKSPKKLGIRLEFNPEKATSVYAGTDMFLMPSRFEPCGLGQLISLRYGSIPIVRAVGGLADTVTNFNPRTGVGNGFVFRSYRPATLLMAIVRAIETYKYTDVWQRLVRDGMRQTYSWDIPAKKYLVLYRRAIKELHHAQR